MAMIKCPECGKEISNMSEVCIYCGYPIAKNAVQIVEQQNQTNLVDLVGSEIDAGAISPIPQKVEAYDVMILEYDGLKLLAKNQLASVLNITKAQAADILEGLPCYIFDDIPRSEAELVAQRLVQENFRVAVYDPVGNVRYYEPAKYINRPLPVLVPAPRRRRRILPLSVITPRPRPVVMPRKTPGFGVGLKSPRNTMRPAPNARPSASHNKPSGPSSRPVSHSSRPNGSHSMGSRKPR